MRATISAMHSTTKELHEIDLEDMTREDLIAQLWELFPGEEEDPDLDEYPEHVELYAPQDFAAHCFTDTGSERDGCWEALEAWSAMDADRQEAFEEYADEVHSGNDAPDARQFEEAYQGQYPSGGDFARETAEQLGEVPDSLASWIIVDWQASWDRNLHHDYSETASGHFFRNL